MEKKETERRSYMHASEGPARLPLHIRLLGEFACEDSQGNTLFRNLHRLQTLLA